MVRGRVDNEGRSSDMTGKGEKFVVDEQGNRVAVVLDIEDYQRILEDIEELEAIRQYDAAKAAGDEAIPFDQAVDEIQRGRQ
jgi:hypothetical protein